jgi:hypothetical protein
MLTVLRVGIDGGFTAHRDSSLGTVLDSVSFAIRSYASATPVMVALAFSSAVFSAFKRISLERERQ